MPFPKEIFCPRAKGAKKGPRPEFPERRSVTSAAVEAAAAAAAETWPLAGESVRESCRTFAGCREVLEALKEEIRRAEQDATRNGGGRIPPGGGGSKRPSPVCRYVDKRLLSLQELKRRVTKLEVLLPAMEGAESGDGVQEERETAEAFLAALLAPSRREARRRKSAPLPVRLSAWLAPIAEAGRGRRGRGRWKACPSYEAIAAALGVCLDSVSRAFRELESDPACPYAFTSGNTGENGARQKLIALKKWLRFDRRPLHFNRKGRSRHMRPSFRRGVKPFELPGSLTPTPEPEPEPSAPPPEASSGEGGNSEKCLSDSIRLSPAVQVNPPAGPVPPPPRPPARRETPLRGLSGEGKRRLERAAWRAAREAKADGELFWDNSKVFMPLASLKTLILGAFLMGFDWETQVRPALLRAIRHAHAAACLSETPIRNPGAFAAAVLRRELARLPAPAARSRPAAGKTPVSAPQAAESREKEGEGQETASSAFSFAEAKAALLRLLSPQKASPPPPPAPGSPEHAAARSRAMVRLRKWAAERAAALESFAPGPMSRLLALRLQELIGEELSHNPTDF